VFKRIHHVAFAVRDLDLAIANYERILGVKVSDRAKVPVRGAEVAIFKLGNTSLELAAPMDGDGPLQKYIDEHGEGFFHLALAVDDVGDSFSELERAGVKMMGAPYIAYKNWRIAYLDPRETGGNYVHLIDDAAD
jgi:methylmalonyl-CoA/ethylmalonyl-CoA epimerase